MPQARRVGRSSHAQAAATESASATGRQPADVPRDVRLTIAAEGFLAFAGDFWNACGLQMMITPA
jgi:hypothetical protein